MHVPVLIGHFLLNLSQVYGGVYSEDKKWYRCRVKELVGEDKVSPPNQ